MRHDDVVRDFAAACRSGDAAALQDALSSDVVAICDGGGLARSPIVPLHGATEVARLVAALAAQPGTEVTPEAVNGLAGLALRRSGRAVAVIAVQSSGTRVTVLWIVLNPAKLRRWHRSPRR